MTTGTTTGTIPQILIAIREFAGLSQRAAAEAAGVSQQNWNRWELGHHRPPAGELERIAEVFEYPDAIAVTEQARE